MIFEQNALAVKWGGRIGFVFSYFLFTTILYYILSFLNKLPTSWTYFHIMGLVLAIALLGLILKRLIK